ncbi:MAG: helix-turn-helix transcriptional regulator, partial [Clostridia bacterium]|nr:helix-turn-helix transcriptional regulator [Clostridia bacterium]
MSRLRIIREAERQFAEKGLYAASVNVIAENAGINKRMIYHYFGSKEDLYKEVLRVNFQRIYAIGEKVFEN